MVSELRVLDVLGDALAPVLGFPAFPWSLFLALTRFLAILCEVDGFRKGDHNLFRTGLK